MMKFKMIFRVFVCLTIVLLIACQSKKDKVQDQAPVESGTRFTLLSADQTGVTFSNTMLNTDEVSQTYEYRFNGAGVAVGDINNDGLLDLFFASTNQANKLYLNKGDFRFEDISQSAGILPREGLATGVTMVDINCDGLLDIYVCRTGKFSVESRMNQLYINQGDLTFQEQAKQYGLADPGYSNQSTFFDYDNDGDLDMYLVNQPIEYTYANTILLFKDTARMYVSDRLYRNNGDQTFTDVTFKAGVGNKAFGFNAAIEDFNNDGYWDVFVTNDYLQPDYLYINNRNGTFTESLAKYMKHCSNSSMGSVVADYNNDGYPDVFELDMMAEDNARQKILRGPMDYDDFTLSAANGAYYQYMRNQLHLNNGNGTFSEIGQVAGVSQTDWSWGPLMVDFDDDGWKDLFIANGYRRDLTNMDYVTYFLDSINKSGGIGVFKTMSELLNALPETPVKNYAFRNKGDLTFENVSDYWGFNSLTFSNGSAYGDLDNDGDLDIVINNIDQTAMIYRNESDSLYDAKNINVILKGKDCNTKGVGARVVVRNGGMMQQATYFPSQGFMSALPNRLHFGLGETAQVDTVEVIWPGEIREIFTNILSGQTLTADINNAVPFVKETKSQPTPMFADVSSSSGLNYLHKENDFIDFKREPLLPMNFSDAGPCMATGDINGDGLEDVFIGGSSGFPGVVFTQTSIGKFKKVSSAALDKDKLYEDGGALFFDADNDKDLDLYVASGGNEWDPRNENYQDRLYINNGKGVFTRSAADALPEIRFSTTCPAASDFDGDGDLDLFVGGRIVSWNYPLSPRSFLLLNENGKFSDATERYAPQLTLPGLVCDAIWTDFNGDSKPDLVVTGQWMAPGFYANENGVLQKINDENLASNKGWWNSIAAADFDNDGDLDYVFGNRGLNSRIQASEKQPARVYAKDFDQNGTLDAIATHYIKGASYPIPLRDQLTDQIRPLKKKLLRYSDYANATVYDLFPKELIESAKVLEATTFSSSFIRNLGNGKFEVVPLPIEAQFSAINGFVTGDFNHDGNMDILFAGNNYSNEVETGRYDASIGGLLLGDGKGGFKYSSVLDHGFFADGDIRSVRHIKQKNGDLILLGRNRGPAGVIRINNLPQ